MLTGIPINISIKSFENAFDHEIRINVTDAKIV